MLGVGRVVPWCPTVLMALAGVVDYLETVAPPPKGVQTRLLVAKKTPTRGEPSSLEALRGHDCEGCRSGDMPLGLNPLGEGGGHYNKTR